MAATTPLMALITLLVGGGAGVLGAVLGIGGGVFLVPVLVIGMGVPMHQAIATSIVSVVATSSAVASTNIERGTANMRLGMVLEIATTLGAISGGLTAGWLSATLLEGIFAVVLIPTAILMWRGKTSERVDGDSRAPGLAAEFDQATGALGGRYFDEAENQEVVYRVRRLPFGLGISFVAGNLSGLLGIGGGVFKVPALHMLCSVPIKAASATSNFMIGVTASASGFLYFGRGEVRPLLTAATIVGVLLGSIVGSSVNRFLHGAQVRRLFAALLLLISLQMLYRVMSQQIP